MLRHRILIAGQFQHAFSAAGGTVAGALPSRGPRLGPRTRPVSLALRSGLLLPSVRTSNPRAGGTDANLKLRIPANSNLREALRNRRRYIFSNTENVAQCQACRLATHGSIDSLELAS